MKGSPSQPPVCSGRPPSVSAPELPWKLGDIARLIKRMRAMRSELVATQTHWESAVNAVHPANRSSACNLLHYVALRSHDLRALQEQLTQLGLSSLGRSEPYVLATVDAVLRTLRHMAGKRPKYYDGAISFKEGRALSRRNAEQLLGPRPGERPARIMVTMPREAADDYKLVRNLMARGMDCARINCAHDDEEVWGRIVEHLGRARDELGVPCRVLMDLAGPKLRTGPLRTGPQVTRWVPRRDSLGVVTAPARIWLTGVGARRPPPLAVDASIPLLDNWQSNLRVGDDVAMLDARGRSRLLRIVQEIGEDRLAECQKTGYAVPGNHLHIIQRSDSREEAVARPDGQIGPLPQLEQPLVLRQGDTLVLTGDLEPGHAAEYGEDGSVVRPATVGCTLPEVCEQVKPGERVLFDDGRIGGVIREATPERICVEITDARLRGEYLRPDKGINLPDSKLVLAPLTPKDRHDLQFVVRHADVVGYSFVRHADDVTALQEALVELGGEPLGILLKIETRQAFERLPSLLLAALKSPSAGVMIARGDLALECGYERMAEVQEEILWMCEAAHLPVVWATQVLESLAQQGHPSRAEITDAAMGERAECVMLNKGPYILEAVRMLDSILRRMQEHQSKKSPRLTRLKLAVGLPRLR